MKAIQSLLVIFFSLFSSSAFPDNKPNIVLILIDDLGLTDIQAYGGEISTPNMDSLASEGVLFTNYHNSRVCAIKGYAFDRNG